VKLTHIRQIARGALSYAVVVVGTSVRLCGFNYQQQSCSCRKTL